MTTKFHKMMTAINENGFVTVVQHHNVTRDKDEIVVWAYGTSKDSKIGDIGAWENRDLFAELVEAAKTEFRSQFRKICEQA